MNNFSKNRFYTLYIIIIGLTYPFISFSEDIKIINSNAPFQFYKDWKKIEKENPSEFKKLIPNKEYFNPKVALVLSGGGARGIAQIGVIRELEKAGIPIDYVVGTSIGAIIGGMLASDMNSDDIEKMFRSTDWDEIFALIENTDRRDLIIDKKKFDDKNLVKVYFKNFEVILPQGLSFANKLNSILNHSYFNSKNPSTSNFDELKIPFRAVATDIVSGKTVVLKTGNISTAVRASSTIPLRHTPVKSGDMLLVDGGLMANLPVSVAENEFAPDLIIAVDVTSPLLKDNDLNKPWTVADQIISIDMMQFTKKDLEKADFKIIPELGYYSNMDFSEIDSLIQLGKEAAINQIDDISDKIAQIRDSRLNEFLGSNGYFDYSSNLDVILKGFKPTDSLKLAQNLNNFEGIQKLKELFNQITELDQIDYYTKIKLEKITESQILIEATSPQVLKNIRLINNPVENLSLAIDTLMIRNLGEPVTDKFITKISALILEIARQNDYSFLKIDSVILNDSKGELQFVLNPGYIENINIIGNNFLREFLIRRELKFSIGEPLSSVKLSESWENLINTNYFSFVDIYPVKDSSGKYNVNVEVVEGGNQLAQIGIRADNERYLQANISFTQQNLLNLGGQVSLSLIGGPRNLLTKLNFFNPRISTSKMFYSSNIYYETYKFNNYTEEINWVTHSFLFSREFEKSIDRIGANIAIGPQIETSGKFGVEFRFEYQRVVSQNVPEPDFGKLAIFKLNFQYDTKDKTFHPTEGIEINSFLESNLIPNSDFISYSKIYFSYSQAYTFLNRHTLNWGIIVGAGDETMPETEMFSLGGADNFWGMREDQSRGRQIVNLTLNYTYRIPVKNFFDMYISLLLNSGRTWQTPESIKLNSFREGMGAKFSIDTPLGPFSLGMGRSFFFARKSMIWGNLLAYLSIGVNL